MTEINKSTNGDGHAQRVLELRHLVDELALSNSVLKALLPGGLPHAFEGGLWDYKEKLPQLPPLASEDQKKKYRAEIGDIIKDVVAFHNAYGGYIVFGVADKGDNRIKGCDADLDCGELNKKLQSYTKANIECLYTRLSVDVKGTSTKVGLLLVPRRQAGVTPVSFIKDGPDKQNGTKSFNKGTYIRVRDECRPATATSEDWLFLHSDRLPPNKISLPARGVRSALPARDPDLIEFLGREDSLSDLRVWVSDARSPIRLITGIGGLGKTTLAYRFSEEVISTAAGELEWVIWLTAKEQTYSALRGKMVLASKVDFSDLYSLYLAILTALSYDMPIEDDDQPALDELADRVVEALSTYSCLLIVDDIDSLSPEQQRETVAALSAIVLRTVGRDIPPSRVLMTSRIDQGLSQTSVIKISGLDKIAFNKYVENLCETFKIPQINGQNLNDFYVATFGSPLFTSSIVRLVSLGENLRDVVETWRNQEGEEVRRFAFEREIKRLTPSQGRLLYAVLLLGETSVNDLAEVLDVTARIVREYISELQAYHLIATSTNTTGDSVVFAPNDLIAITNILKQHLGAGSAAVEIACAKAQERAKTDIKSIGLGIRSILNLWENRRYEEGVISAHDLRKRFPKSGDAASILGAAMLRVSPPRFKEADVELETARRLGCTRPELFTNIINVKSELEDWRGLHDFTKPLLTRDTDRDAPLNAFTYACEKLIGIAKERKDYTRVAELCLEVIDKINVKISRHRLDQGFFARLTSTQFDFAREYIFALELLNPRPGDKLFVFEGVSRLAESNVILLELVRKGLTALQTWWRDVEARPVVDSIASTILARQLRRLEKIERQLQGYGKGTPEILGEIDKVSRDLGHRGARLGDGN